MGGRRLYVPGLSGAGAGTVAASSRACGVDGRVAPEGDTVFHFYTWPIPWIKVDQPTVGDWWWTVLPLGEDIDTWDLITGFGSMDVGGSTIPTVELDVYLWDDDSYMGRKWYGENVGLIGWDVSICNEHYTTMLQSWNLVGGSGYWPMAVGNEWTYLSTYDNASVDAPVTTITVDGIGTDWLAVVPVLVDDSGDDPSVYAGADIRNVRVAVSGTNLCLMMDFWDGQPDTAWGKITSFAYRFDIEEWSGSLATIGVYYEPFTSTWELAGSNINLTGATTAVEDVVEVAIPMANLGYPSELPFVYAQIGDGSQDYDYTCYITVNVPEVCPITTPGDVTGEGNITTGDIIYMVNFVFKAGPDPVPCQAAADMDCSGGISPADIIYLVNTIFKAGPAPCDVCPLIPGTWSCP